MKNLILLIAILITGLVSAQNTIGIGDGIPTEYVVVDRDFNHVFGENMPFHITWINKEGVHLSPRYNREDLIRNFPLGLGSERNQYPELHYVDNMGPGTINPTHVFRAINPDYTDILIRLDGVISLSMEWQWPNPGRTAQGIETNANPQRFGLRFFKQNN